VDGRIISPQMIDEMAESYDKSLFTALIWPEHQRYVNYGTVEEVRATDNEEGGRDLWAILSPNSFYTGSNQYGQKLFTSMEITPDFRKTGKAYLSGLGATDDPASAATSEIRLSKVAVQGGIILTKTVESIDKTFEDTAPGNLLDQIKELFTKNQPEGHDMADKAAIEKLSKEVADVKTLLSKLVPSDSNKKQEDKPDDQFTQLSKDIASLKELFSKKTVSSDVDGKTELTLEEKFSALTENVEAMTKQFSALQKVKDAEDKSESITPDQFKQMTEQLEAFGKKLADALKEQPGTDGGEHFGANNPDAQDIV
ncbi:MAG: GPO family capsid scaffolding protein, partial [Methylobacter sp.]